VRRGRPSPHPASTADLLPVDALGPDGLLVREDGALVRMLEVVPTNPLVLDAVGCQRMTRGFTELLARVPSGSAIQCYACAQPVALTELLAAARRETDDATGPLVRSDDPLAAASGQALRRLALAHERSLLENATAEAAVAVRYLLVVPWAAPHRRPLWKRASAPIRSIETHQRLARESLVHTERLRSAMTGLDLKATQLDAQGVLEALASRLAPDAAADRGPGLAARVACDLSAAVEAEHAERSAARLRAAICRAPIDMRDPRVLGIGDGLEQAMHLAGPPERTFYGWLLHAMQSPLPWTLSVHIRVRDRAAERERQTRRARRLWGVNEAALDRRARPDRVQYEQQNEVEQLVTELSTGAETVCDVSIYQTLRVPGPCPDRRVLEEHVTSAVRALGAVVDAPVGRGEGRQRELLLSSLPLGLDAARCSHPMISRNAADSIPFVSTSCGSPDGLPFAFADPGRTVERLDPFDRTHDNGTTVLLGKSGGGKTMTSIALASAALPRGCQVNVIDRSSDHWRFLATLIPGAASLSLGAEDGATINAWDVDAVTHVPLAKVAFLVRLHALLIGDHVAGDDGPGLGAHERNLLAHAIRETYVRAAAEERLPRESLLRDVLRSLARDETRNDDGTPENAAMLRSLADRLGEFCAGGTYAYLFDQPTSVGAHDAPLVVFNTREVPDDVLAPVLFAVLEFVSRRVERRHETHRRRLAKGHVPAGSLDGTSMVVLEELWSLLRRRITGGWVNELVRRARHIGLWFVAVTQQRTDLAGPEGRALLDNATIQLFHRNGAQDLAHLVAAERLAPEEAEQISRLTTEKRAYAQAYVVNGERGRGAVAIRLAAPLYWLATSDPHVDVPLRELALEHAGLSNTADALQASEAAFRALDLLADPAWHEAVEVSRTPT
jgi:DNA replication protein DnaC